MIKPKSRKQDGRPSFQFYPNDWISHPALSLCSLEAQGLWMHLLCRMWFSPERGVLLKANGSRVEAKHIAHWVSETEADIKRILSELEDEGVSSTRDDGAVYNRRMVKDESIRQSKVKAGRKGGLVSKHPSTKKANRGSSSSTSPSSTTSTSKENPLTPKGGKDFTIPFPMILNTSEFKAAWNDWSKHRREIGKKLTKTSVSRQIKMLGEMGHDRAIAAIEYTILNGWIGIREETKPGANKAAFVEEAPYV